MKKIKTWFKEHADGIKGWSIIMVIIYAFICMMYGLEVGVSKLINLVVDRFDLA